MGHGIAQVFAQAGHEVLLKGRSEASLAKAHKAMDKNLSRMVEKGKLEAGLGGIVLIISSKGFKHLLSPHLLAILVLIFLPQALHLVF